MLWYHIIYVKMLAASCIDDKVPLRKWEDETDLISFDFSNLRLQEAWELIQEKDA